MSNRLPILLDETELILQLREKDRKALSYLYVHYASALYGVIVRIVKTQEVAEEVLQDSFIRIWDNVHRYDPKKGRLFTWMLNIARNLSIDKLRSKEFSQNSKTDYFESEGHIVGCNIAEEPKIRDTALLDLLRHLTPQQQMIIQLIYFQGYTHRQVSEEFDIPLGTVKTRLRSTLITLRKILKVS